MSATNIIEAVEDNSQQPPWDIVADHGGFKINQKFVLKLPKGNQNVIKEVKDSCKVLFFSSNWNFEDVLLVVNALNPKEYPQLFILIIESTNLGYSNEHQPESTTKVAKLQKKLLKFGNTRPMILQLTLEDENVTKIYFKEETLSQFIVIDQQQGESKDSNAFTSILRLFLDGKFNNSEIEKTQRSTKI